MKDIDNVQFERVDWIKCKICGAIFISDDMGQIVEDMKYHEEICSYDIDRKKAKDYIQKIEESFR